MILVDTNVVSEPLKPLGDPRALRWLDAQEYDNLYFAAISLAELLTGISAMPDGRRRQGLLDGVDRLVARYFPGRVLAYDEQSAHAYARLYSGARRKGIALSMPDCQIASIAETNGMIVATRDVKPFRAVGLRVVNPWDEGA